MFLCDETVDLRLQRKVSPRVQQVHPLDFESMKLIVDRAQLLRTLLDFFYK